MAGMARKRTTVVLTEEDERALRAASKREGVSQSELIRKGIRTVTAEYRRHPRPLTGWLKLSSKDRAAIVADEYRDLDG